MYGLMGNKLKTRMNGQATGNGRQSNKNSPNKAFFPDAVIIKHPHGDKSLSLIKILANPLLIIVFVDPVSIKTLHAQAFINITGSIPLDSQFVTFVFLDLPPSRALP